MLIKLENGVPTGAPLVVANFRQLFPTISFPLHLSAQDVASYGYGLYDFSAAPTAGKHEKVVESPPVRSASGVWVQAWSVVEMTPEEKAEQDTAKAFQVRNERNIRLSQSDWSQIADSPVDKQVWLGYRQALRDVPAQAGFPWGVAWPKQP